MRKRWRKRRGRKRVRGSNDEISLRLRALANVIALLIGLYYPKRGLNDKISFVRITFD